MRFIRIWVQTVIPPVITVALYFIIFGQLIGSQIGDIDGYRYMDYIVPGLILMSVITNSYSNVVSSFFSAKWQRSIEEMIVAPLPSHIILIGFVSGGIARGVIVGIAVMAVSMLSARCAGCSWGSAPPSSAWVVGPSPSSSGR